MPRPRRTQISLEDTPYYHCCSRVVRRAFLCGDDAYSGKNYDHRRGWVESLLFELEAVFAIGEYGHPALMARYGENMDTLR